jgi:hypothetical protein
MSSPLPLSSLISRPPVSSWDDVHPMFGDAFFSLDGVPLFRGDKPSDAFMQRCSVLFDDEKIACGDLIPETSWGASLANLLTSRSWETVRELILERNHHVCQCCGVQRTSLDVHELWSYAFPDQDEIDLCRDNDCYLMGVQKLENLISVCSDCHLCFHLGFANSRGRGKQALARLRALNNWSVGQIFQYERLVYDRWNDANEIGWQLDFARLAHPDGGLEINAQWELVSDSDVFLQRTRSGLNDFPTVLLNTTWCFRHETEWRAPNPFPESSHL